MRPQHAACSRDGRGCSSGGEAGEEEVWWGGGGGGRIASRVAPCLGATRREVIVKSKEGDT